MCVFHWSRIIKEKNYVYQTAIFCGNHALLPKKKILYFSGKENIMMSARGTSLRSNALHSHTHLAYTLFNVVLIPWYWQMWGIRWLTKLQKKSQSKFWLLLSLRAVTLPAHCTADPRAVSRQVGGSLVVLGCILFSLAAFVLLGSGLSPSCAVQFCPALTTGCIKEARFNPFQRNLTFFTLTQLIDWSAHFDKSMVTSIYLLF